MNRNTLKIAFAWGDGFCEHRPMKITSATRAAMLESLEAYLAEEMSDVEITQTQQRQLLCFVTEELGPVFYNAAVADARRVMLEQVEDLDPRCYEPQLQRLHQRRQS